jgi:uncharacterized protein involved in exopolysaccharide biosynthesis
LPYRSIKADDDSLIPMEPLKRWVRFGIGAARRHRLIALATFLGALLFSGMVLLASPPTYQADGTVLIQDNSDIFASVDPGRQDPGTGNASNGVQAVVTSRSSLRRIMEEANLLDGDSPRTMFGNLRSKIRAVLRGQPTLEDRENVILDDLETAILVTVSSTGEEVAFIVLWPDPAQARDVAAAAINTWLDSRRTIEVEAANEATSILQDSLDDAKARAEEVGAFDLDEQPIPGTAIAIALEEYSAASEALNLQLDRVEVAEAAFEYRYKLLDEPRVPPAPVSSSLPQVVLVCLFSLGAALAVAAYRDLRSGKVHETWQIERTGVPVVGAISQWWTR